MNLKLISLAFVFPLYTVWSQSGLDSGPWPTQDDDSPRGNQSGLSGPASAGNPQRVYDAGSPILSELVITCDGKLVLAGFSQQVVSNQVVAIDSTGKAVWPAPFTLVASNNESPIGFTVDASGRIYVANHDWPQIPGAVSVHLYASMSNGTSAPNWPTSSFPAMYEPPAIAADGTIPGVLDALAQNTDGTFALMRKTRMHFIFSSAGQLMRIVDRKGNTQTLTYDGSGNLTSILDSSGGGAYDADDRLLTAGPAVAMAQMEPTVGKQEHHNYYAVMPTPRAEITLGHWY